jgi:hypothetical protein
MTLPSPASAKPRVERFAGAFSTTGARTHSAPLQKITHVTCSTCPPPCVRQIAYGSAFVVAAAASGSFTGAEDASAAESNSLTTVPILSQAS